MSTQSQSAIRNRYTEAEIEGYTQQILRDGFCILKGHFPKEKLQTWKEAFDPLMEQRIQDGTASERGPKRFYISLPFTMPFADPAIYEDPDILAILERLGGDIVMPELASDTPLQGSDFQVIHRDHLQMSPDLPDRDPALPFQFAVNFPLVDVTLANGPFEVARGTHLLTDAECKERIRSGEMETQLEPLMMEVGDVMIRDVRALHRGTPNHTETPRTMIVVGYNCAEHQRPQLKIHIPQAEFNKLSGRGRQLLRLNPVVESLDAIRPSETYSNLYFLEDAD